MASTINLTTVLLGEDRGTVESIVGDYIGTGGYKNYLYNGDMSVFQRGAVTIAEGYTADGWYASDVNRTYSAPVATISDGEAGERMVIRSVGSDTGFIQRAQPVEFKESDIGKEFTFSFKLSKDAGAVVDGVVQFAYRADNKTIRDGTKIGIVATADILPGFNTYSATFTVPAFTNYVAVGIVFANLNNTQVTQTLFRIGEVMLEKGSNNTAFEQKPRALELNLCRYYYRKSKTIRDVDDLGYEMRTTPTQIGTSPYTYSAEF